MRPKTQDPRPETHRGKVDRGVREDGGFDRWVGKDQPSIPRAAPNAHKVDRWVGRDRDKVDRGVCEDGGLDLNR